MNQRKRLVLLKTTVFIIIILSTLGLLWFVLPAPVVTSEYQTLPIQLDDAEWIAFHGSPVEIMPLAIKLEIPRFLRPDETGMLVTGVVSSLDPSSEHDRDEVQGQYTLVDLAGTYQLMFSARLEFPGFFYSPPAEVTQPVIGEAGQQNQFQWTVRSLLPGEHEGTIWLFLRIFKETSDQEYRIPVMARTIQLEARDWRFFSLAQVRLILAIISGLSLLVYFILHIGIPNK